jgi:hypothetical protein
LNRKTNGTIRKCSSRTFQWMVMSVGFKNHKNMCLTLFGRNCHQSLESRESSKCIVL